MVLRSKSADEVAGYDKCLLVGEAYRLACLDGVDSWRESGETHHGRKHHVDRLRLYNLVDSLRSGIHLDVGKVGKQQLQRLVVRFVRNDDCSRAELARLLGKHLIAVVSREAVNLVAVAMLFYHVECLGSDRTGGTEDTYLFHCGLIFILLDFVGEQGGLGWLGKLGKLENLEKPEKHPLQLCQSLRQIHSDGAALSVHLHDELVGGRNEQLVAVGSEQTEERVDCRIVNRFNLTDNSARSVVNNLEADDGSPRELVGICVDMLTREVDIAASKLASTLLRVDIGKAYKRRLVVLEAVFVEEEWHEYAVNLKNEVVGVYTVEDIVVEVERHLAVYAVRLANLTYFIY